MTTKNADIAIHTCEQCGNLAHYVARWPRMEHGSGAFGAWVVSWVCRHHAGTLVHSEDPPAELTPLDHVVKDETRARRERTVQAKQHLQESQERFPW